MRKVVLIVSLLALFQTNAQNFKFGKVSKAEVEEKVHPVDKDANAAILYRNQKVYYDINKHEGLSLIKEVHERVKIYNKEGFDWATKEIRKYKGKTDEEELYYLKGYTFNLVDGKLEEEKLGNDEIFDEDRSKYYEVTKFTMPAVKEGSVIEYVYKIKSKFLGSIGKTPLQYRIPLNKLELDVQIPEFFVFSKYFNLRSPLNFKLDEGKDQFTYNYSNTQRSGNRVVKSSTSYNSVNYLLNVYKVDRTNIPALKKEPHVDNLESYAAFIDWELMYTKFPNSTIENYSQDWEGVAKSIYNDLGIDSELKKDSFYDDELDELLAGLSDPMMKTAKIFNFVKQKVKWNDYLGFYPENGTKNAYKDGIGNIGDINFLLISMLQYAGINAHPILLSTPSNGIPLFPTRDGFNYVIAGIELSGKTLLLDASDPLAGLGELPKRARNWQGRIIREDGSSDWVNVRPETHSEIRTQINVMIENDIIKGRYNHIYDGLFAKEFRDDQMKTNEVEYVKGITSGVEGFNISKYKIENKEKIGSAITENYNFELTNASNPIGDKIYIHPFLFETIKENPFKASERTYPVFFDFPKIESTVVNIMIPQGYKAISVPESNVVKLGDNLGQFKFIVNQSGTVVRISSEVSINTTAISTADYKFLKKFYDNIIKKHGEAIVLEKESEDGLEARAESGR